VGFVSLTFVTSFEVVGDISSHPRPVVALLDTMIRAFYAVMASRWGVVILFQDSRSLMIGNEKLGGFFVVILGVAIQHSENGGRWIIRHSLLAWQGGIAWRLMRWNVLGYTL
jgi:hypothetical protein